MATISRGDLEAYAIMLSRLQRRGGKQASSAVRKWLGSHPSWDAAQLRAFAASAVADAVTEYGGSMASLACDLYDGVMSIEGVLSAAPAEPWDGSQSQAIARAVRYQLAKALAGDLEAFAAAVDEMSQYYARQAANQTIVQNVERDHVSYVADGDGRRNAGTMFVPSSYGRRGNATRYPRRRYPRQSNREGTVAYARIPTGLETCTYCMMLASRGFVYTSAQAAGHANHRGCNCLIVPGVYRQTEVSGIDISAQYECWRELEAVEAHAAKNPGDYADGELQSIKEGIVGGYENIALTDDIGEVTKHASEGVRLWYEPRPYMAAASKPTR